jgi:hypothetical protein
MNGFSFSASRPHISSPWISFSYCGNPVESRLGSTLLYTLIRDTLLSKKYSSRRQKRPFQTATEIRCSSLSHPFLSLLFFIDATLGLQGVSALPNKLPRSPIAASILVTNQITRVLNLLLSKCHRPFKLIYDRFLWSLASLSFNDRPLNNFYECRTRSGQFTTL